MRWISDNIVTWLIRHDTITVRDRELYEYAVYSLIITFFPLLVAIIVGGLMDLATESILLILPFTFIRKFSGGFHTQHVWTCLASSSITMILCTYLTIIISCSLLLGIITLSSALSLCANSPIDSENRRLKHSEKKRYQKMSILFTLFFTVLYGFLILLGHEHYAVCISIGLILSAVLQMPYILPKTIKNDQK
jgi:accessory gene regulator B